MPRINNPKPPKRAPKIDTRRGAKKKPCSFCQHGVDTVDYKDSRSCASTSRTAARFADARSRATASSTSATSPTPSRPLASWRCCPTRSAPSPNVVEVAATATTAGRARRAPTLTDRPRPRA